MARFVRRQQGTVRTNCRLADVLSGAVRARRGGERLSPGPEPGGLQAPLREPASKGQQPQPTVALNLPGAGAGHLVGHQRSSVKVNGRLPFKVCHCGNPVLALNPTAIALCKIRDVRRKPQPAEGHPQKVARSFERAQKTFERLGRVGWPKMTGVFSQQGTVYHRETCIPTF